MISPPIKKNMRRKTQNPVMELQRSFRWGVCSNVGRASRANAPLTHKQRETAQRRDAENDKAKSLAVDVTGEKRRDGDTDCNARQKDRSAEKLGTAEQSERREDGDRAHIGELRRAETSMAIRSR